MQLKLEKKTPGAGSPDTTPRPAPRAEGEMTARMHFYAVRSAGEQLRWGKARRPAAKRPERMEGR